MRKPPGAKAALSRTEAQEGKTLEPRVSRVKHRVMLLASGLLATRESLRRIASVVTQRIAA